MYIFHSQFFAASFNSLEDIFLNYLLIIVLYNCTFHQGHLIQKHVSTKMCTFFMTYMLLVVCINN